MKSFIRFFEDEKESERSSQRNESLSVFFAESEVRQGLEPPSGPPDEFRRIFFGEQILSLFGKDNKYIQRAWNKY